MRTTSEIAPLGALLDRSGAFETAILEHFPDSNVTLSDSSTRHEVVAAACMLCIEHAHVLRSAFAVNAPNSASALLRLQYEALLRSAWLLFAATPGQEGRIDLLLNVQIQVIDRRE